MAAGFWSRLYGLDSAFCDCQPAASLTRMVARKKAATPGFFYNKLFTTGCKFIRGFCIVACQAHDGSQPENGTRGGLQKSDHSIEKCS
jgi:hypothetical protein